MSEPPTPANPVPEEKRLIACAEYRDVNERNVISPSPEPKLANAMPKRRRGRGRVNAERFRPRTRSAVTIVNLYLHKDVLACLSMCATIARRWGIGIVTCILG